MLSAKFRQSALANVFLYFKKKSFFLIYHQRYVRN